MILVSLYKKCNNIDYFDNFSAAAEDASVEDMPPLEGDEADDSSKMEEVD